MYRRTAFSLIELLVVVTIISLLMAILVPALSRARQQVHSVVCQSNIRQIYLANVGYASENDEYYVRAAFDLYEGPGMGGGRHRWHGVRESLTVDPDPEKNTFDPNKGPLRAYLADGKVKQCPQIVNFVKEGSLNAFEAGCGGYGYNSWGVGSRSYIDGPCDEAMRSSMKTTEVTCPWQKIMFTDAASVEHYPYLHIIEYSFCEPPSSVVPSIHFRHREKTNVIWCDGHTSSEEFAFSKCSPEVLNVCNIGWFGPRSHELFKP